MFKSLIAAALVTGSVFFTADAFAQRHGDTTTVLRGCGVSTCTYETWTYMAGGPNGGWQLTGVFTLPRSRMPGIPNN